MGISAMIRRKGRDQARAKHALDKLRHLTVIWGRNIPAYFYEMTNKER